MVQVKKIILASASPRRKELLAQAGLTYKVFPSTIDEKSVSMEGKAWEVAERLALAKARDVAEKCSSGIVLGADTVVALDHKIFGKPENGEDAFRMLRQLSGREHQVITGLALIDADSGLERVSHQVTRVFFEELTDEEIRAYIRSGEPFDKAGAYGIQGLGALLVKKIDGCYFNVVGLPLSLLRDMLRNFGIFLLEG